MKRRLSGSLGAAVLATLVLQTAPALADPPAHAQGWRDGKGSSGQVRRDDDRHHDDRRRDGRNERDGQRPGWNAYDRDDDRWDGNHRDEHRRYDDRGRYDDRHRYEDRYRYDDRHRYDRPYYPTRGHVVTRLPYRHRVVHHHGHRYYYGDGIWYRPSGAGFMVVTPPLGLVVSFLPEFYNTLYFGGVPYYRAQDVYYVWRPHLRGYVVTDRPW